MRLALWFSVIAFLLSGITISGIIHSADGALQPALIIGLIAGFIGFRLEAAQHTQHDNPNAREYPVPMMQAFAAVQYVITGFQRGSDRFQVLTNSPQFGKFVASMNFVEEISALPPGTLPGQFPSQPRCISLEANFVSITDNSTRVRLRWTVQSTVNRDTCDEIINHLTANIDQVISAGEIAG